MNFNKLKDKVMKLDYARYYRIMVYLLIIFKATGKLPSIGWYPILALVWIPIVIWSTKEVVIEVKDTSHNDKE